MRRTGKKQNELPRLGSYLMMPGRHRSPVEVQERCAVYSQGDEAADVYYIQRGTIKLTTVSTSGKEAVVALLNEGSFFGEGCLLGQPKRMATATAMSPTSLLVFQGKEISQMLHENETFADQFILHMLKRNARIEEDLVDQLFNSTEKRLARTLLLLAHYGKEGRQEKIIPRVSQETLAEIIGTNRGRVNIFMNKFRKLGYIKYNGGLHINSSLVTVVLHD